MVQQKREQIQYLFLQYLEGKASENEKKELSRLLIEEKDDEQWENIMEELMLTESPLANYQEKEWQPMIEELISRNKKSIFTRQSKIRWISVNTRRIAAAAVIILLLSVGGYFYFNQDLQKQIATTETQQQNDVTAPKVTKAMITLANGQTVALDSLSSGTLATQGDVKVIKNANGEIVYSGNASEVTYNTLYNPRGSKVVNLTLQDGSKVWLNAESSLKYPVAFIGNDRKVEITGEAYFEVNHDATKKFLVNANGVTTEVLGTHFNINAYGDEAAIKTTLLEGSVKVSKGSVSKMMKPGEQAQVNSSENGGITVQRVNVEEAIAWKNGFFSFNKANIQIVMNQISRWYDVDVSYEGVIRNRQFNGEMERNLNLSQVLKALEKSKVHFRMEGKRLIVMP